MALFLKKALLALALLGPSSASRIRAGQAGRSIHLEIGDIFGQEKLEAMQPRIDVMAKSLEHTFLALPKNSRGAIGASAASYALHRLLLQMHGWQMKDLQPHGGAWHEQSPTAVLQKPNTPPGLHDLFEERLSKHGLDLQELAVLAASIEQQVRAEADKLLNVSFRVVGISDKATDISEADAFKIMEAYMASYVLGTESYEEGRDFNEEDVRELRLNIVGTYSRWFEVRDITRRSAKEIAPAVHGFDFSTMSSILLLASERFFRLEETECQSIKDKLLAMEETMGSGRVMLGDFYRRALHQGDISFTESVDFLRDQGALDESEAERPRVIIPNYMQAHSNCLASSAYYSVCCSDPCEELMDQIETAVKAPAATPDVLLNAVKAMPISHLTNRTVDGELKSRLEEVAVHHDGEVPLHGRLFAQWMHHAFPRHCPFPHVSGTSEKKGLVKFQAERHASAAFAPRWEMRDFVEASKEGSSSSQPIDWGMWFEDEELVDPEGHASFKSRSKGDLSAWTPITLGLTFLSAVITLRKIGALGEKSSSVYHQKMI
eukprot:TRINITY_DN47372_c0_g1_i1.p1 TRINITY_DN47372_c0_g1~~TRINITY_DN47372_c0_g1_i1.p1  ORF type:complete len:548 (-),score=122.72 TRINITY_DN47372_c0_g1_i1:165-1808(-)